MHALIMFLALSSIGADAYVTNDNQALKHHYELNPICRTFLNHGTGLRVAYFGGSAAGFVVVDRSLRRKHKKLAMVLELGTIAAEGYWTTYSIQHAR
jgi:hypothetical protein